MTTATAQLHTEWWQTFHLGGNTWALADAITGRRVGTCSGDDDRGWTAVVRPAIEGHTTGYPSYTTHAPTFDEALNGLAAWLDRCSPA